HSARQLARRPCVPAECQGLDGARAVAQPDVAILERPTDRQPALAATLATGQQHDPGCRDRVLDLRIPERDLHALAEQAGPETPRLRCAIAVGGTVPVAHR